jgi:hypothetical protein
MNAYVGWNAAPWSGMPDERRYQIYRRTSVGKGGSLVFLFGEIHAESLCRPMFGMNMDSSTTYHVPGSYHGQISTFSFVDGHAEAHKWRDSNFNNPRPAPANWHSHGSITVRPASLPDLAWLKQHTTFRN